MRTRMYGGVGGEEPRGFPLSRSIHRLSISIRNSSDDNISYANTFNHGNFSVRSSADIADFFCMDVVEPTKSLDGSRTGTFIKMPRLTTPAAPISARRPLLQEGIMASLLFLTFTSKRIRAYSLTACWL